MIVFIIQLNQLQVDQSKKGMPSAAPFLCRFLALMIDWTVKSVSRPVKKLFA